MSFFRTGSTTTTTTAMLLLLLSCTTSNVAGFSVSSSASRITSATSTRSSQLFAVLPDAELMNHASLVLADAAVAVDAAATAAAAADSGWWAEYLDLFKKTLSFVHDTVDGPLRSVGWTQTWGVSIAIFTVGVRSLLIPLSIQQNKSTEYMKALKPYISDIKKKFKDNDQAKNQAIGKLYQDADQNPLSGCLTSLIQLPVLLGLYRGIRLLAQDGDLNEPFLWIPSLQGPVTAESQYRGIDWLTTGWHEASANALLPLPIEPQLGWETTLAFLIMPVTLVLLQSFTMTTLTPPPAADDDSMSGEEKETMERTQGFLKFLPLLIGFFSLQVPAGLTIYWFTTNLFTLTQTLAVRQYFVSNPPTFELPEYWDNLNDKDASEMTPEERREAAKAGLAVGPTMEDLLDEAKFHSYIERYSVRETDEAWKKVASNEVQMVVPEELQEWVNQYKGTGNGAEHLEKEATPFYAASGSQNTTVPV